jgi:hypothetical protein
MAKVGRLAGALLAQTQGRYFLVGNPRRPCDWAAAGFVAPGELDALARPFVELELDALEAPRVDGPFLRIGLEGEPLLRRLTYMFVIERNVSDRLWRLVLHDDLHDDPQGDPSADLDRAGPDVDAVIDARWLGELPPSVWRIVRDSVLKCL